MLLSEALSQFKEWGMSKYALNTVHTYTDLIQRFIKFSGDRPVEEVDVLDTTKYYIHLKKKNYAESSIAYMMISLRQFFKFLFLRRIISWDYQLIAVPKYVSKSYLPIESKEARGMIDSIRSETFRDLRNKTMISFLYSSGLRVSELCDLKVTDLKLGEKFGVIVSKKNRKIRMVFWDDETAHLLESYLPARTLWATTDYVFISLDVRGVGKKLTTKSVQRIVAQLRPHKGISPHSFRHGLGLRAVKAKIHPRHIQKILGHLNLNSSQIYMDVAEEDVKEAYREIA